MAALVAFNCNYRRTLEANQLIGVALERGTAGFLSPVIIPFRVDSNGPAIDFVREM